MNDCGCTHHPGLTHEEYMDDVWKRLNRQYLERAICQNAAGNYQAASIARRAFTESEIQRLREKRQRMERMGR